MTWLQTRCTGCGVRLDCKAEQFDSTCMFCGSPLEAKFITENAGEVLAQADDRFAHLEGEGALHDILPGGML